jgi:hypothetical protein
MNDPLALIEFTVESAIEHRDQLESEQGLNARQDHSAFFQQVSDRFVERQRLSILHFPSLSIRHSTPTDPGEMQIHAASIGMESARFI